jgi:hypothetical protein
MMEAWNDYLSLQRLAFPRLQVVAWDKHWLFKYWSKMGWGGITVYNTVYMNSWDIGTARGLETLRHEMAHVRDQHKYGILFLLSYIFILPTVFTMRAFWEWRGYKETLRSVHEEYKHYITDGQPEYYAYIMDFYSQWVTKQFTGLGYFFMFPFKNYMYQKCRDFVKSLP